MFKAAGITKLPDGPHRAARDGAALKSPLLPREELLGVLPSGRRVVCRNAFRVGRGRPDRRRKGRQVVRRPSSQEVPGSVWRSTRHSRTSCPPRLPGTPTRTPRPTPGSWQPARLPCTSMAPGRSARSPPTTRPSPPTTSAPSSCRASLPDRRRPVFMGGSDLAIAKNSPNQAQALDWVKIFTGTQNQLLQASNEGFIPNATNLVSQVKVSANVANYFKAAAVSVHAARAGLGHGRGRQRHAGPVRGRSPRASRTSRPSPRSTTRSSTAC